MKNTNCNFILHPSLSGSPRNNRVPKFFVRIFLILFLLFGSLGGPFLILSEGGTFVDHLAVRLGSEPVVGKVVGKSWGRDDNGIHYGIDYRYTADGTTVEARDYVDTKEEYEGYEKGRAVRIYRANLNHKASALSQNPPLLLLAVGGGLILSSSVWGISFSVSQWKDLVRSRKSLREGIPLEGEILELSGQAVEADYLVTLKYAFVSPRTLEQIVSTRSFSRKDLEGEKLPQEGSVTVLYVDDDTHLPI